jgi:D-tyrosyl-tRNA(Tyr) deacylase
MKTVIQRVKQAAVTIEGKEKREINQGLVILAAFGKSDDYETCQKYAQKIKDLRIFSNTCGKFDYSVLDIKGEILVISQFTLYGDCSKGKRPDFLDAAPFEKAKELYNKFIDELKVTGLIIKSGEFGADMLVEIHNDGPVTIILY